MEAIYISCEDWHDWHFYNIFFVYSNIDLRILLVYMIFEFSFFVHI